MIHILKIPLFYWSKSTLIIPAAKNPSKNYKCIITHPGLKNKEIKNLDFTVISKPKVSFQPSLYNYEEGATDFSAICKTDQLEEPKADIYKFLIDGFLVQKSTSTILKLPNYGYTVDRRLNERQIVCVAENLAGSSDQVELLNNSEIVAYGPEFISDPDKLLGRGREFQRTIDNNRTLELMCNVDSVPKASIQWFKGGSNKTTILSTNNELSINEISFEDAGKYFCEAKNHVLNNIVRSDGYLVKVQGRPRFVDSQTGQNRLFGSVSQMFELTLPTLQINFKSTPMIENIKIQWNPVDNSGAYENPRFNTLDSTTSKTETYLLLNQDHEMELSGSQGRIELVFHDDNGRIDSLDQKGTINIYFNNYKLVPEKMKITLTNSYGEETIELIPKQGDKLGKIAAIVGGSIAGIILIIAAIIAGIYYNERQRRSRTYSPANSRRNTEPLLSKLAGAGSSKSSGFLKPGSENTNLNSSSQPTVGNSGQYAGSLTSSQRDDGYITEHSQHTSYKENGTQQAVQQNGTTATTNDSGQGTGSAGDIQNSQGSVEASSNEINPIISNTDDDCVEVKNEDLSMNNTLKVLPEEDFETKTQNTRLPTYQQRSALPVLASGLDPSVVVISPHPKARAGQRSPIIAPRESYDQQFIPANSHTTNNFPMPPKVTSSSNSQTFSEEEYSMTMKKNRKAHSHLTASQSPRHSPNIGSADQQSDLLRNVYKQHFSSNSSNGTNSNTTTGLALSGRTSGNSSDLTSHNDDNLYKTISSRRKVKSGQNSSKYVVRSLTHV